MFGRRRREEAAAADAAREAERRALFARLAERPEHICPFLGLEGDRTGYVEGVSDEHRCFAFGDPAPISAEQQTRVCQERGYGNCPRYLRGVLVIPTEELEALRRPRAPIEAAPPPPPPAPAPERRRRGGGILVGLLLLLLVGGGAGAFLLFGDPDGIANASPTPSATVVPPSATAAPTDTPAPTGTPELTPPPPSGAPTPEPTPEVGDTFAFYEVSVAPDEYTLYQLDDDGVVADTRISSFDGFSFARVEALEGADGDTYWVTQDGDLTGWSYRYPDSGEFRVRAVFLNDAGERRSEYLEQDELTEVPEATPAP
ncbi:MAG TPA: hypothetical protein VF365_00900 [Candidatus Limnocylindria bacterium]